MTRPFAQVDVFAGGAVSGNPVAVVHDADGLSDEQMLAFARWTNLSETTFIVSAPDDADYSVRIFTPGAEIPFAGHPTLGTAHAWLERGGKPRNADYMVQHCGAGLVRIARGDVLQFRAPPFFRSGNVDPDELAQVARALNLSVNAVRHASWIDNGPGWMGLVLESADAVLKLRPDNNALRDWRIGVIGPYTNGPADFEVRAFAPCLGVPEDPVTGSLNAGFGVWLTRAGLAPARYSVRQGTVIGRQGDVTVSRDAHGDVWVGGACHTVIKGTVDF